MDMIANAIGGLTRAVQKLQQKPFVRIGDRVFNPKKITSYYVDNIDKDCTKIVIRTDAGYLEYVTLETGELRDTAIQKLDEFLGVTDINKQAEEVQEAKEDERERARKAKRGRVLDIKRAEENEEGVKAYVRREAEEARQEEEKKKEEPTIVEEFPASPPTKPKSSSFFGGYFK